MYEVKEISIPTKELSGVYEALPKIVTPNTEVDGDAKFKIGVLLRSIKKYIEVYTEQHIAIANEYKTNMGDGQYGAKLIIEEGCPPTIDIEAEKMFAEKFKELSNSEVILMCPQIPFKIVEKLVSGKDLEYLAGRFIV